MAWRMNFWKSRRICRTETSQPFPGSVLKVIYRPGEDGYIVAECPQLPGCMSQGKTRAEAERNIIDAIRSVLAVRLRDFVRPDDETDFGSGYTDEEKFCVKWPELTSV